MFRLENEIWLWALLIVPFMLILLFVYMKWHKAAIKRLADSALLPYIMPRQSSRKIRLHAWVLVVAVSILVLGVANPQLGSKLEEVERKGIDLMVCLDISNSMLAEDIKPNRLERSKMALERLVDKLKGDRIGIVVFAGKAFVQLPITSDYAAAKMFLKSVNTNTISVQGTDIGAALSLALESFNFESTSQKAVIVITDGEDHEGEALRIAKEAAEKGVYIHTIGMGSEEGSPIPIYRNNQLIGFRKDRGGNTVVTKLNENMLMELAEAGNGKFVRASTADSGLEFILNEINALEKTAMGSRMYTDYEDRFQYLLFPVILLLIFEMMIGYRKSTWIHKIKLFRS